jgi:uncharacterized protein (DUF1499 family)
MDHSDSVLAPCPASPNCVSSTAPDKSHRVEPIPFTGAPAAAMERLRTIIEALPRARIVRSDASGLHAEFTSWLLRFVDDVDCVVDASAGVIHVRSASRVGYSDLGVNRKRVEQIRAAFAARA